MESTKVTESTWYECFFVVSVFPVAFVIREGR